MKNKRDLELVTSLSLGCKNIFRKIPFLVIYHLGNFDDLMEVVSEFFQKLYLLIYASQFMMP